MTLFKERGKSLTMILLISKIFTKRFYYYSGLLLARTGILLCLISYRMKNVRQCSPAQRVKLIVY